MTVVDRRYLLWGFDRKLIFAAILGAIFSL
jgi:hypothetical protein